jgi:hypothetical protein
MVPLLYLGLLLLAAAPRAEQKLPEKRPEELRVLADGSTTICEFEIDPDKLIEQVQQRGVPLFHHAHPG